MEYFYKFQKKVENLQKENQAASNTKEFQIKIQKIYLKENQSFEKILEQI